MAGAVVRSIPRVFDRYMLPKVAFAVITGASLAGAVLTGLRHGISEYHLLGLRWAAAYTLALLLGAEVWKIFYLRPSVAMRPVPGAVEYGEAMLHLHRRWQQVLTPLLLLLMSANLWLYTTKGPAATPWIAAAAMALTLAVIGLALSWQVPADAQHQDIPSWLALAGLAALAAAVGGLDVALQSGASDKLWLLAPNRALHLWAFSAWLGGALWNIFIAVPAGLTRINMDTVILANFQLERFRVVVRAVFPTIILTGLIQAWAMFGFQWQSLFTNLGGWLILAKIGLILLLVGVFITCPMWKACSPIRGVCDLDDL